jgi:hypothetical protein
LNLDRDPSQYRPLIDRVTKYAIPIHSQFIEELQPLAGIFELSKSDIEGVNLSQFGNLEKFQAILHHTYRNFIIERLNMIDWHFKVTSQLLNQVFIYTLKRTKSDFTAQS